VGDARATIDRLAELLAGWAAPAAVRETATRLNGEWDAEVERLYARDQAPAFAQSAVIGAVNRAAAPGDVVVCAAGSMPGDLHKLWRARAPAEYHLEYGSPCIAYELRGRPGGGRDDGRLRAHRPGGGRAGLRVVVGRARCRDRRPRGPRTDPRGVSTGPERRQAVPDADRSAGLR